MRGESRGMRPQRFPTRAPGKGGPSVERPGPLPRGLPGPPLVLPLAMAKTIPLETFEKLPKTDLHVHLDGSLRLATILELAEKQRVELPADDADGLRAAMHLGKNCGTLVEYLKAFDVTLRVMQTEESLRRIAYELAEDAASENVRYMEVRYSPMLHTRRGLKLTTRGRERCSTGFAQAQEELRHRVERHPLRHPQRVRRSSLEMAELPSRTKAAASSGSISPARSTTIRPSTTRRPFSSCETTTST